MSVYSLCSWHRANLEQVLVILLPAQPPGWTAPNAGTGAAAAERATADGYLRRGMAHVLGPHTGMLMLLASYPTHLEPDVLTLAACIGKASC